MASAASNLSAVLSSPTRAEVLSLCRSLLRTSRKFCDYNIKEYTKIRTIDSFRQHRNLSDTTSVASSYLDGKAQLEIAERQAIIYSLYQPNIKSVMDLN